MSNVGFQLEKIRATRKKPLSGNVTVSTNVAITGIDEQNIAKGTRKILKFSFDFSTTYGPELGEVTMSGSLLFTCKPEEYESAMSQWQKEKKLDKAVGQKVVETLLNQCNVVCTLVSREVNLPAPFPTRKVSAK